MALLQKVLAIYRRYIVIVRLEGAVVNNSTAVH